MALQKCTLNLNRAFKELQPHGTLEFPCAGYRKPYTDSADDVIPWHWHEELEIVYIAEGNLKLQIPGKTFHIRQGQGFVINSNILHFAMAEPYCDLHSLVFHPLLIVGNENSAFAKKYITPLIRCTSFDGCLLEADSCASPGGGGPEPDSCASLSGCSPEPDSCASLSGYSPEPDSCASLSGCSPEPDSCASLSGCSPEPDSCASLSGCSPGPDSCASPGGCSPVSQFTTAFEALSSDVPGYEFIVRERLSSIGFFLYRRYQQEIGESCAEPDQDTIRIRKMLDYIHGHYAENLELARIAKAADIGERECLRCFQRAIQISPMQYLLKYRVTQAASLLLQNPGSSIAEISSQAGFDSPSNFAQMFKRFFACTPREYRKKNPA